MSGKYDDILNLPHHVSATRPRMPAADRAELREGIRAADWSELIQRLEDLGS